MLLGIGQGRSFPCASNSTERPAIGGCSTVETTGNGWGFSCARVGAAKRRANATPASWGFRAIDYLRTSTEQTNAFVPQFENRRDVYRGFIMLGRSRFLFWPLVSLLQ